MEKNIFFVNTQKSKHQFEIKIKTWYQPLIEATDLKLSLYLTHSVSKMRRSRFFGTAFFSWFLMLELKFEWEECTVFEEVACFFSNLRGFSITTKRFSVGNFSFAWDYSAIKGRLTDLVSCLIMEPSSFFWFRVFITILLSAQSEVQSCNWIAHNCKNVCIYEDVIFTGLKAFREILTEIIGWSNYFLYKLEFSDNIILLTYLWCKYEP